MGISIYFLGVSRFASPPRILFTIHSSGFGAGMAGSAVFVSINAVVEPAHKAVANSGLQLAMPIGMLLGVTAGSAVMLDVLQRVLDKKLLDVGLSLESRTEVINNYSMNMITSLTIWKIIKKSIANVDYIRQLPPSLGDIVVGGYVVGLRASFGAFMMVTLVRCKANTNQAVVLVFSLTGLAAGSLLRERRL